MRAVEMCGSFKWRPSVGIPASQSQILKIEDYLAVAILDTFQSLGISLRDLLVLLVTP